MKSSDDLDKEMVFLNSEVEELKLEKDCIALQQEVIYMRVNQTRQNLRFSGTGNPEGVEDTQQVLVEFIQTKLKINDTGVIGFQRIH